MRCALQRSAVPIEVATWHFFNENIRIHRYGSAASCLKGIAIRESQSAVSFSLMVNSLPEG